MANAHRASPRIPSQASPSRPSRNHAQRQSRRGPDRADSHPNPEQLPVLWQLDQLAETVTGEPETYLRYSLGPEADARQASRDYESGLELPGLSVVPLTPPAWWRRPVPDWLARQICKYAQLAAGDDNRYAWILKGQMTGRGPDHEPLITQPQPLAVLSTALIEQAQRHYHEHFEVGRDSRS
jgi:hypothetical protein